MDRIHIEANTFGQSLSAVVLLCYRSKKIKLKLQNGGKFKYSFSSSTRNTKDSSEQKRMEIKTAIVEMGNSI